MRQEWLAMLIIFGHISTSCEKRSLISISCCRGSFSLFLEDEGILFIVLRNLSTSADGAFPYVVIIRGISGIFGGACGDGIFVILAADFGDGKTGCAGSQC